MSSCAFHTDRVKKKKKNIQGDTPVDIATKKQFTDVLKVFKEASNEFCMGGMCSGFS